MFERRPLPLPSVCSLICVRGAVPTRWAIYDPLGSEVSVARKSSSLREETRLRTTQRKVSGNRQSTVRLAKGVNRPDATTLPWWDRESE